MTVTIIKGVGICNKQTLLFKDTIIAWLCVSLGRRTLSWFLIVGCLGTVGKLWSSGPLLVPGTFFGIFNVIAWVFWLRCWWSSEFSNSCCWLLWILPSIGPTDEFCFRCWVTIVELNSAETDLDYRKCVKVFRICDVDLKGGIWLRKEEYYCQGN